MATQTTTAQRLTGQGDRFFTFIRWFILVLLLVLDIRFNNRFLFPPLTPFALVWLLYALFSVLLTITQFITLPALDRLMTWSYLVDLGFLTVLAIVSGILPTTLYPLFLLPIIWAALRRTPFQAMVVGLIAAGLYTAVALIFYNTNTNTLDEEVFISLLLNMLTIVFIAWITSVLAERQSVTNREQVVVAQRNVLQSRQEAEAYRDRMRSLYEVALSLSTSMKFQQVLETMVKESLRIINGSTSLVLLPTGNPDELYVAAGEGLAYGDLNRRIEVNPTGILGTVFASGAPKIINQLELSPAMQAVQAFQSCSTACCVPLTAGRRNYGILIVAADQELPYANEMLEMVSALANYAIISMLNAQLSTEVQEERTKLMSKEEEVRQQLARDLHDGPAQSVAAITMNIEFVKRLIERDPQRVVDELTKLGDLARRTTYDIRTLLFELRPLALDSQGLVTTLKEYVERFKDGDTKVIIEEQLGNMRLDTKREGTIFNIIQEATNNALKHAQAKHIWIRLQKQGDELMATVQDDGRGFDLQSVRENYNQRGSFGLLNIDERARMVGGMAEMNSAPGAGTTVRVIVPLEDDTV